MLDTVAPVPASDHRAEEPDPEAELAPELIAVTIANLAAAAFRFSILRTWVFRPRFGTRLEPVALTGSPSGGTSTGTTDHTVPERMSR